jgi:hypothetical protein
MLQSSSTNYITCTDETDRNAEGSSLLQQTCWALVCACMQITLTAGEIGRLANGAVWAELGETVRHTCHEGAYGACHMSGRAHSSCIAAPRGYCPCAAGISGSVCLAQHLHRTCARTFCVSESVALRECSQVRHFQHVTACDRAVNGAL